MLRSAKLLLVRVLVLNSRQSPSWDIFRSTCAFLSSENATDAVRARAGIVTAQMVFLRRLTAVAARSVTALPLAASRPGAEALGAGCGRRWYSSGVELKDVLAGAY